MSTLLTVLIIITSTAIWLKYLDSLDLYKKDKKTSKMVYICFASGIISTVLVLLPLFAPLYRIEHQLSPLFSQFLVVGLSEECSKYFMLILTVLIFRSIKEPQDGIIQGAAVGAGFGALENLLYGLLYGPNNAIARSFFSISGHMLYTALSGYFLATAIYSNLEVEDRRSILLAILAIIPAAFLHGVFNASLTWQLYYKNLAGLGVLVDMLALILTVKAFRSLLERSPYYVYPYSRAREAVQAIRRGLKLNPGSFILNNRIALYYLALEDYSQALKKIRYCRRRLKKRQGSWDVLEGIALLGLGKDDKGIRLLERAKERFEKGEQFRLERVLSRIIRDAGLKLRVNSILRHRKLRYNPYFERLRRYGKRDYWKSDQRILKERMEALGKLIKDAPDR